MNAYKLGNTGLNISPVGLGIGGILGEKIFNEGKSLNIVQTAIDNGINFFDTGSSYSYGNAELRLGKVLSGNCLDNLTIATKGGTVLTNRNKWIKNYSKTSLTASLDLSLRKLGIERVDLFQLHSPSLNDINDEVLNTLNGFRKQGKIKHIGVSCDGVVLDKAIDTELFDTVMLTYNCIEQQAEKQIVEAKKKGKGVLIKSPMAHSLYSSNIFKIATLADVWYLLRVLKNYRPELYEGFKYRFMNKIDGWTGAEIALKFVVENKHVDCALIGTTRVENLMSNINVIDRELDQIIYQKIKSSYRK